MIDQIMQLSQLLMQDQFTISFNLPVMTFGLVTYSFNLLVNAFLNISIACWYLILSINPSEDNLLLEQYKSLFLNQNTWIHLVSVAYKWEVHLNLNYLPLYIQACHLIDSTFKFIGYCTGCNHKQVPYKDILTIYG